MGKRLRVGSGKKINRTEPMDAKKKNLVIAIISVVLLVFVAFLAYGSYKEDQTPTIIADIVTDKGTVTVELYPELMPKTVDNFVSLAKSNFYNGLKFHRVENWVIQGGDPKGDGTGGPDWTIPLETHPKLLNVRGAVAMARNSAPDSAGSQFYILKQDASQLNGKYAVFGKVTAGMEIVDQIQQGDKIRSISWR